MDRCPVGKQGPLRATLPVPSVMKNRGTKKNRSTSPPLSPTSEWRRVSVDQALAGERNPEVFNYQGKGRFGASVIRRSASLDSLYHKGQWSRDYYLYARQLQVDKSTQTDETGGTSRSSSRSSENENVDRFLRSLLQRPHKPFTYGEFSGQLWSRYGGSSVSLRTAQSSVDGLNQEIERLVMYPVSGTQTSHLDWLRDKVTPEGHRAPFAFPRRRSVNTQTPPDLFHTAHSSGGSVCSSPEINFFLARDPPNGCVKVKKDEGAYSESVSIVKPIVLRASLDSAFQPGRSPSPPASSSL